MSYNIEDLFALAWRDVRDLSLNEQTAYAWVLYQINDDQKIFYSQCNSAKQTIVDLAVKNKMLEIECDVIQFTQLFKDFMNTRRG